MLRALTPASLIVTAPPPLLITWEGKRSGGKCAVFTKWLCYIFNSEYLSEPLKPLKLLTDFFFFLLSGWKRMFVVCVHYLETSDVPEYAQKKEKEKRAVGTSPGSGPQNDAILR